MKTHVPAINSSEITPINGFLNRRQLMQIGGLATAAYSTELLAQPECTTPPIPKLDVTDKKFSTTYNNYYEFSTDKKAVAILAKELTLAPWEITVGGLVETPQIMDLNALKNLCESERLYRFRCVEGWSMVVPWLGVPFSVISKRVKPLSSAKFVTFTSCFRPQEMIGQRRPTLAWPYVEALRIDEANHPLTILATGMYGEPLPPQNGAPTRLVVPWKYGFKSAKAIVAIEFVEQRPTTSWMKAAPSEYGFYANVNPSVAHPRWSQSREAPLGQAKKVRTLMFNGYAEEVAHLYSNMNLQTHY